MDINRHQWNQGHQTLHRALTGNGHQKAVDVFLSQHAMVHAQEMSDSKLWSFEDEVLNHMTDEQYRCIPPGWEHSIAWIFFHIARIEDITMNMLVAGTPQLFVQDGWMKKLHVSVSHSANSMRASEIAALSAQVDIDTLRAYRQSVGRRTRQIVQKLKPDELKQKVNPSYLQKVLNEGALLPEAIGILNYWSKRTIAGLLLMPPTRHNFLHLNEASRIKQKLRQGK